MTLKTLLYSIAITLFCILPLSVSATTVSPVTVEVTADPGQTLTGEINVVNSNAQATTYTISAENFVADGENGVPRFIGAEDGLASWIETPENVDVLARDRSTVTYSINVPDDANPGGYFASIFFNSETSDNSLELSIESKVGVLILLRVNGDISEAATLREFKTLTDQYTYELKPVEFTYLISNSGGDRIIPFGELSIQGPFGRTLYTEIINPNKGNVLPGSNRRFHTIWGEENENYESLGFFGKAEAQLQDFHFGRYTAILDVNLVNSTSENLTVEFFMFPWQLLTIIITTFITALTIIILTIRKYRHKLQTPSYMDYLNRITKN